MQISLITIPFWIKMEDSKIINKGNTEYQEKESKEGKEVRRYKSTKKKSFEKTKRRVKEDTYKNFVK